MRSFRKKAARAASIGAPEPTDSPFFGGIIDPEVLREIDATNPVTWMRKESERLGLDPNEANFPEAWAAGRELAKGAYARRLREARPIPREPEGTKVAGVESLNLMNLVAMVVGDHVKRGEVVADDVDLKGPMTACVTAYAITLRHLFEDHWTSA